MYKEDKRVSGQCEGENSVGGSDQCEHEEHALHSSSSPSSLTTPTFSSSPITHSHPIPPAHPKKILSVFGTRPEVIKMAPVVMALKQTKGFFPIICTTSQHREMQNQMMALFGLKADYDLDCMKPGQDLFHITTTILSRLKEVFEKTRPDLVLVQGDTTTSFVAALAAFYCHIPIGHVEAGLRTHDLSAPFPEEANRALIGRLARLHFAPTQLSKDNLLKEAVPSKNVFVTGNTVIDALFWMVDRLDEYKILQLFLDDIKSIIANKSPFVLITGHRRESFGDGFDSICEAIKILAEKFPQFHFIYPVHLNPNVQRPVNAILNNIRNVHLISPVDYEPFVFLMKYCYLILSDSGGVQEEAPSLGKPVLVMREKTERMEGVNAGTAKLVGTNTDSIVKTVSELILSKEVYNKMANAVNPYGDGNSSKKIIEIISEHFDGLS